MGGAKELRHVATAAGVAPVLVPVLVPDTVLNPAEPEGRERPDGRRGG